MNVSTKYSVAVTLRTAFLSLDPLIHQRWPSLLKISRWWYSLPFSNWMHFFHFYSSINIVFFRRWVLIPVSRPLLLTVFTTTSNTSTSYFRYFVKSWHFRYFDNKSSIVIYFRIEGEATQSRATSTTEAPPPWRATLRWYSIILQSITGISEFKTICSLTWRWCGLAISQK